MAHQQPDLCKGMRSSLVGGLLQRRADSLAHSFLFNVIRQALAAS